MKKNDIVVGAVVLVVFIAGILILRGTGNSDSASATPAPTQSTEEKFESSFKIDIPEDADKAELEGASGTSSTGIATREVGENQSTVTVLADLPELESGQVYKAYVAKAESEEKMPLGSMRVAKGGWIVEYKTSNDLSEYKQIQVVRESSTENQVMLQGSFN